MQLLNMNDNPVSAMEAWVAPSGNEVGAGDKSFDMFFFIDGSLFQTYQNPGNM